MKISVVVPVHNEAENIISLIKEIDTAMHQAEAYEIIYVDDGSTDQTPTVLAQALKDFKALRVIRHAKSCGQSTAVHTGVKQAIYPYIATLDGDGQNDPADIPRLFRLMNEQEPAVILGNRISRNDSVIRKLQSKIGNHIRNYVLKGQCPDTGCSLKFFSRTAFLELPFFNHMHRFLPDLFARAGYQLINTPVNHRPRLHGISKYGLANRLFVGIYDLIGVRWLLKRHCLPELFDDEK